ncbi:MAG: citrate synthase/methylcitrate synthase [Acidimicrobiia bacterium]|nr:citrate synthase/methylcitrate synthase [Acidimicrobiia bacterium]
MDTSETTQELVAPPGLKGLVVADTTIGSVRGAEGFYHYRRYDAVEIARHQTFEAAARLLIDGELPIGAEEALFRAELGAGRRLEPGTLAVVRQLADRISSPLTGLTAAIPLVVDDTPTIDLDHGQRRARCLAVAAAVPSILAALHRHRNGDDPLDADPGLGHAADFIRMATGSTPTPRLARAVETYLVLTADHGFNASTFTTRVITSTGAGVASALAGAVGALSGPLHGGAPSRVLDMLEEIGDPVNTERWARATLAAGRPIMGFGHAVYRADDPRSTLLKEVASGLGGDLVARAIDIEARMLAVLAEHKPQSTIVTNVEYYAAVVLHLAGLPQPMFTPAFTTSRVVGWVAHLLEQAANNKIMRPLARYVGPEPSWAGAEPVAAR